MALSLYYAYFMILIARKKDAHNGHRFIPIAHQPAEVRI